jgi:hypothetical protein
LAIEGALLTGGRVEFMMLVFLQTQACIRRDKVVIYLPDWKEYIAGRDILGDPAYPLLPRLMKAHARAFDL